MNEGFVRPKDYCVQIDAVCVNLKFCERAQMCMAPQSMIDKINPINKSKPKPSVGTFFG
jgi:hypothetical protein